MLNLVRTQWKTIFKKTSCSSLQVLWRVCTRTQKSIICLTKECLTAWPSEYELLSMYDSVRLDVFYIYGKFSTAQLANY